MYALRHHRWPLLWTTVPLPTKAWELIAWTFALCAGGITVLLLVPSISSARWLLIATVCAAVCWPLTLNGWASSAPRAATWASLSSDNPRDWTGLPQRFDRFRDVAEQVQRDWIMTVARDGLIPLVRREMGPAVEPMSLALPSIDPSRLGGDSGLDQLIDTESSDRLAWLIGQLGTASLGISGPRGVGKSTVLKRFCSSGFGPETNDVVTLVQAPTVYDRREFLVHLFSKVCETVCGGLPDDMIRRMNLETRLIRMLPLTTTVVGVLIILGAVEWPALSPVVSFAPAHPRTEVVSHWGIAYTDWHDRPDSGQAGTVATYSYGPVAPRSLRLGRLRTRCVTSKL